MSLVKHTLKPVSGTGYPGLAVGPARRAYEADMRAGRIDEVIRYHFPLDGLTPVAWRSDGRWNVVDDRLSDLYESDPEALDQVAILLDLPKGETVIYHDEFDHEHVYPDRSDD